MQWRNSWQVRQMAQQGSLMFFGFESNYLAFNERGHRTTLTTCNVFDTICNSSIVLLSFLICTRIE